MNRKSLLLAVLWVLIISLIVDGFGLINSAIAKSDKVIELKYQTNLPGGHILLSGVHDVFISEVEKNSKGRIKINVFPGTQLSPLKEAMSAVTAGVIDMILLYPSWYAGQVKYVSEFIALPYNFPQKYPKGYHTAVDLWYNTDIHKIVDSVYRKQVNAKVLYSAPIPGKTILLGKGINLNELEDFKGLKLRVGGGAEIQIARSLKASPVKVTTSEIYIAFQRGLAEAAVLAPYALETYKLKEVCGSILWPPLIPVNTLILIINQNKWNSLDDELKEVMEQAAKKQTYAALEKAIALDSIVAEKSNNEGVKIIRLSDEENGRVEKALMPVWDWYIREAGPNGRTIANILRSKAR